MAGEGGNIRQSQPEPLGQRRGKLAAVVLLVTPLIVTLAGVFGCTEVRTLIVGTALVNFAQTGLTCIDVRIWLEICGPGLRCCQSLNLLSRAGDIRCNFFITELLGNGFSNVLRNVAHGLTGGCKAG